MTNRLPVRIVTRLQKRRLLGCKTSPCCFPIAAGSRDFAHEQATKAPEAATAGGATGGVLGGLAGWLVGIGALAIPGLGPFVAAGPIMAALSAAAAGAAVGGLAGGVLIGMGIPEYEAKQYEGKLREEGNLLILVHTEDSDERESCQAGLRGGRRQGRAHGWRGRGGRRPQEPCGRSTTATRSDLLPHFEADRSNSSEWWE